MSKIFTPEVRNYLYPVALAVISLAGGYGLIADQLIAQWTALAAAVLGVGTATAFRPGSHPEDAPDID